MSPALSAPVRGTELMAKMLIAAGRESYKVWGRHSGMGSVGLQRRKMEMEKHYLSVDGKV